jgi:putative photosynthetic complex assembly protein
MSTGVAKDRPDGSQMFSPRLIGLMGCLCLAAIAITAFGRLTGIGVQQIPQGAVTEFRDLKFFDAARGMIDVVDAVDNTLVQRLQPGEGGFIRTVMRGFAHDRMAKGGDNSTSFRLTQRDNGHLIMSDAMTGRQVILDSFGKLPRDQFARLLKSGNVTGQPMAPVAVAGAADTKGVSK